MHPPHLHQPGGWIDVFILLCRWHSAAIIKHGNQPSDRLACNGTLVRAALSCMCSRTEHMHDDQRRAFSSHDQCCDDATICTSEDSLLQSVTIQPHISLVTSSCQVDSMRMRCSEPRDETALSRVGVKILPFSLHDVVFLAACLSLTLMVTCETGLRIL